MSSCEINQMLEYIYNLKVYREKPNFDNILKVLELLGNPQKELKIIHITGTNGKGSTCNFIKDILFESGYKVGLFTSPHLLKFNERIRINDELISDYSILKYVNFIKNLIESYNRNMENDLINLELEDRKNNKIELSFFEFITCFALFYFKNRKVDFVILEAGVGGQWDPTNCIKSIICGITNVSLDHTKILGHTIEEIAIKKSGIIKNKCRFFTSEKNKKIIDLFEKKCIKENCEFNHCGDCTKKLIESKLGSQKWIYFDKNREFIVETKMNGLFQIDNANLAISICLKLSENFENINTESIVNGIKKSKWKGRLELIKKTPKIIIDGAHNKDAFCKLNEFFTTINSSYDDNMSEHEYKFKTLIVTFSNLEKINDFIDNIGYKFDNIIITKGDYKSCSVEEIYNIIKNKLGKVNLFKFEESINAIKFALENFDYDTKDILLVTGSLYLIGKIRNYFKNYELDKKW